jgi:phosphomannomutase/phosphoglucomutase
MINRGIFREYDIRGIADRDLTDEAVMLIGKAYGTMLKEERPDARRVTVGRDIRHSSKRIRDALIKGIASTGVDIIDIGECPTPLLYFSTFTMDVDGGVMITASHNPPEYNGLKVCIGKETRYGAKIKEILDIIEKGDFAEGKQGSVEEVDITASYTKLLKDDFKDLSGIKAVVDAGNGTGGLIAPELLRSIGVEVIPLFCEADGNFPNHHPDPTIPENLETLIETVRRESADVGIAYDGDTDRIGVVDEKGNIIWGDHLMVLFARDILKGTVPSPPAPLPMGEGGRRPGEGVVEFPPKPVFVGEVKCSQVMYDEIEKAGGRAIMWKAGHSLIKDKMKKEKAVLAGEMSGHIFFGDRYFGYDDAIYATCRVIEILVKEGRALSELLSDLPKTFTTPEIRVDCPDEKKFGIVEEAKKRLARGYEIIDIDGVRVKFKEGWALIRASNTQPVLVMRFEATSDERLKEYRELVEGILKEVVETGL